MNDKLLTVTQVADELTVSIPTVYGLVKDRKIETTRVGRAVRFTPEAVADYKARNRVPVAGAE